MREVTIAARKIKQLRIIHSMSKTELALRSGLAVSTVTRVEQATRINAKYQPKLWTLKRLGRALGVRMPILFTPASEPFFDRQGRLF